MRLLPFLAEVASDRFVITVTVSVGEVSHSTSVITTQKTLLTAIFSWRDSLSALLFLNSLEALQSVCS